ncbi:MAG: ABC transporter permease [Candidatus Rokuibacteriota bacterium]
MSATVSVGVTAGEPRGRELMASLRRSERAQRIRALMLVLPAIGFLLVAFVVPILSMLGVAVANPELREVMPRTAGAMGTWDGSGLPGSNVVAIFIRELREVSADGTVGKVARRLNYGIPGFRSLLLRTGRSLPSPETPEADLLPALVKVDPRWGQAEYWLAIKRAAPAFTDFYLLAAVDLTRDARGAIVRTSADRAIFVTVLVRTFWVSFVVTAVCLVLGYPIAHLLASLPARQGNVLMILVLLPFWTSVLVRTTAWLVLLQREGVVNDLAVKLGLVGTRIELVHNRIGVYVAMVHILLPFMVLPIYSVLRRIPPIHMRAAATLGARPFLAFRKVYFPQSLPGVTGGCLLVFILALGFYVTPALVGGPSDQLTSYFIALFANEFVNWGMAAALSAILLATVVLLLALYQWLVPGKLPRLG